MCERRVYIEKKAGSSDSIRFLFELDDQRVFSSSKCTENRRVRHAPSTSLQPSFFFKGLKTLYSPFILNVSNRGIYSESRRPVLYRDLPIFKNSKKARALTAVRVKNRRGVTSFGIQSALI